MAFDFTAAAGTLKEFSVVLAVLMAAYVGLKLATTPEIRERGEWKEALAGVVIGLVLLFLAPLLAAQFTGGSYCKV